MKPHYEGEQVVVVYDDNGLVHLRFLAVHGPTTGWIDSGTLMKTKNYDGWKVHETANEYIMERTNSNES